jgi:hypothetical protein
VLGFVKRRFRDSLELAICYALIMAVIWTPNPAQRILFWITFAWILATTLFKRVDLETLGPTRGVGFCLWL